jgi:AAA domain
VSTDRWEQLARAVRTTGTVVMFGDEAQLGAIDRGGMWPLLARGGIQLTEVYRTTLQWERDAWSALRHGRSAEAFAAYAEHGQLRVAATRAESLERAVRDWARDGRTGLLITDASNAERDWLNDTAQEHRRLAGELGEEHVTVARPHGETTLHQGDRVLFTGVQYVAGGRRIENGTMATVHSVDPARGTLVVVTGEAIPREVALVAATAAGAALRDARVQGAGRDR